MVFQTVMFILSSIVLLTCIVLFVLYEVFDIMDDPTFLFIVGLIVAFILVGTFSSPNQTIYFETDFNLADIIENTDYKVIVQEKSITEKVDYIAFEERIFGRKRIVLHTDDSTKYIKDVKEQFEKYRK